MFKPTLITQTLNPSKNIELAQLLSRAEVALCDVDYTLIDISAGHAAGVRAVAQITSESIAQKFDEIFHLIVKGHRVSENEKWKDRKKFEEIVKKQNSLQKDIVPHWGLKYWSKSTMMLIAAEELGIALAADQLCKARNTYWETRTKHSHPYEYCADFYSFLYENGIEIDIFTSSYHILQIADNLDLSYEPESSKKYKIDSISPLLPKEIRNKIIGDPIDKPAQEFFEQVYDTVTKNSSINPEEICVIGDSLRNDLQYLGEKGCRTILIKHT